jgi:hypothetical protein
MSGGNYNWFLHTMLFMHTLIVIEKQVAKSRRESNILDDEPESELD